jgi:hypothetical protein
MFKNLTNGKRYVGSSVDLRDRMYSYYNVSNIYLLRKVCVFVQLF